VSDERTTHSVRTSSDRDSANESPSEPATADPGALRQVDDDTLVQRYIAGDNAAFDLLYKRHRGPLYRYFTRQSEPTVAHDLYQETWLKFINAASSYEPQEKFQAYLFRIAHNVLMDHYRKIKGAHLTDSIQSQRTNTDAIEPDTPSGEMEPVDQQSDLLANLSKDDLRQRLHEEVARLPIHQRTTWLIKQESQLSLEQIAKLTQTTMETVRSRLRYANDKLRQGMQRYV